MATETLRPGGAGSETNLPIYVATCAANWQCVDEVVADDLTTCLRGDIVSNNWLRDLYDIPAHSVGSGTINNVTIYFRVGGAKWITYSRSALLTHATAYDGDTVERAAGDWAWYNNSQVYTTNPNTGSAWTWAEVDAMEIGASLKPTTTTYGPYFTQIYVVIDYTLGVPRSHGFIIG